MEERHKRPMNALRIYLDAKYRLDGLRSHTEGSTEQVAIGEDIEERAWEGLMKTVTQLRKAR